MKQITEQDALFKQSEAYKVLYSYQSGKSNKVIAVNGIGSWRVRNHGDIVYQGDSIKIAVATYNSLN